MRKESWRLLGVEISFASRRLQRLCESAKELQRSYGKACAQKLMTRLADLVAARTLEDLRLLPGRCHELKGKRKGQLALDLAGGIRLIFRPSQNPTPVKEDGGLDWQQIDAVEVTEILDYHE
jgi:proteic killer suppression protein